MKERLTVPYSERIDDAPIKACKQCVRGIGVAYPPCSMCEHMNEALDKLTALEDIGTRTEPEARCYHALLEEAAEEIENCYGRETELSNRLREAIAEPEARALTIEELREMDEKPVWLETGEVSINEQIIGCWEILERRTSELCELFWFTRRVRGFLVDDYGKTWLAYDREPKMEGTE